jgi:hypothetical protein
MSLARLLDTSKSTVGVSVSSVVLNGGLLNNWQWGWAPRHCLCCLYQSLLGFFASLLLGYDQGSMLDVQHHCLNTNLTHCCLCCS